MASYKFIYKRGGTERRSDLWLEAEISLSPMVDEYYDESGEVQLEEFIRYVKKHAKDQWMNNSVSIYWSVVGDCIAETAPFQPGWPENFLSFYTWPVSEKTGRRLDWYRLPVKMDRFPAFARALGWKPSPLQLTCNLRSIWESHRGFMSDALCYTPEQLDRIRG